MSYFDTISELKASEGARPTVPALAAALRASWDVLTAYQGRFDPANPAAGQCYPTSRVVAWFYPDFEVVRGEICTGPGFEQHFWNVKTGSEGGEILDLSWEQFPSGSKVQQFDFLRTGPSADSQRTRDRCLTLLTRVVDHLGQS